MQINKISNISFGQIILNNNEQVPASLVYAAKSALDEHVPNNDFNPKGILNRNLINKVIENDYDTPQLKARFQQLLKEQKNNLHDIHLDLYLDDLGEIPLYPGGWYQKATIGKKVFKQRVYASQGGVMDFLEDACKYANKLKQLNIAPEVVKNSHFKNAYVLKFLSLFK